MTALRIGYSCHDAFPATTTNTQQIFWTTCEVARLGHTIDLRVPALESGGDDARARIASHYGAAAGVVPDGLRFVADGSRAPSGTAGKAWFDARALWAFSRRTHDLVWTRDPLALAAALQNRVPAVFETYRPDFASARAFAPWRAATIGHSRRMGWLGDRRLAGVIAHSALAADAFVAAGVDRQRVVVAHNGFAPSLMEPRLSREEARAAAGLPVDRPLLVYAGHVGQQKGTDALMALAAALPEMRLLIVGVDHDSAARRWVEDRAARAGARNIVLVPRVGLRDVARYLYAADCLIIPPTGEPLRRYRRTVLPMKVFSYLAAGRPILAPALPDLEEVLTNDGTAVLVPPDDTAAAVAALRSLLPDEARAARLSAAALAHSRQFTWEARARTIVEAFERWTGRDA
ncbi:MAG TPA: glycosyltransferase family 4 protein [Vicinamibacterales bacterium]|nr:glycosyltransferase family 4 protein [Vicinamibacterales bacterium]